MKRFLHENWIWIAAPMVLVPVGVLVLYLMTGDAPLAPMGYSLF